MSKQGDAFNKLYDQIEKLETENAKLRSALKIYAKPENWTPYKTRHRRIWIYHCYEDGFKIAQDALQAAPGSEE